MDQCVFASLICVMSRSMRYTAGPVFGIERIGIKGVAEICGGIGWKARGIFIDSWRSLLLFPSFAFTLCVLITMRFFKFAADLGFGRCPTHQGFPCGITGVRFPFRVYPCGNPNFVSNAFGRVTPINISVMGVQFNGMVILDRVAVFSAHIASIGHLDERFISILSG